MVATALRTLPFMRTAQSAAPARGDSATERGSGVPPLAADTFESAVVNHLGGASARAAAAPVANDTPASGADVSSGTASPSNADSSAPNATDSSSSGAESEKAAKKAEAEEIGKLKARDMEVRAHEQAHAAVGGAYAGAPSYELRRGPDGRDYAVSGEVSIDVSEISGDPEATIQKMQQVKRAALAPAEPSGPDHSVAASADAKILAARRELIVNGGREAAGASSGKEAKADQQAAAESGSAVSQAAQSDAAAGAGLQALSQHSAGVTAYRAPPAFAPGRVLHVQS